MLENDLVEWLPKQRWFASADGSDSVTIRGRWVLTDGDPRVEILLIESGSSTYVVPLVFSTTSFTHDLVGRDRNQLVYDATDLRYGQRVLLETATSTWVEGHGDCGSLTGSAEGPVGTIASSKKFTGEQSNTSIMFDMTDGSSIILKIFRVLNDGLNPDVILTRALAEAGSPHVAAPRGSTLGTWREDGREVTGHLCVAQEFLPGARDAWVVMVDQGQQGIVDRDSIAKLGEATRAVHATLADVMPTVDVTEEERRSLVDAWRRRAGEAITQVPSLISRAAEIGAVFDAALTCQWPALQRIHGDYHLGQVLEVPDRGWVVLDFEGEPLRPLAERAAPDLALRDVAGMLRSFDYVGGHLIRNGIEPDSAREWVDEAQAAFLSGYGRLPAGSGDLLRALELDKALYEVSYEVAHRPDWLDVPLAGIDTILGPEDVTSDGHPAHAEAAHVPAEVPGPLPAAGHEQPEPAPPSAPTPFGAGADVDGLASNQQGKEVIMKHVPGEVSPDVLASVAYGDYHAPHDILGPHLVDGTLTIRVIRHLAVSVTIITESGEFEAEHEYNGVWVAAFGADKVPDYRVRATYSEQLVTTTDDPYRFLPTIGELDLYLYGEGRHEQLWRVLGSHVREYDSPLGVTRGASFAVWAPNARAIRVVGDFNHWSGKAHAMRSLGSSGVWELFIPGAEAGQGYKYEIQYQDGSWHQKADPMARRTELPPLTASVITKAEFEWDDDEWLDRRTATNPLTGPVSIYEVHLGSWRLDLDFRELAEQLVGHVTYLGFTHVEFMPVAEHPYGPSWGYQVTSYYAPTARFGTPDEFRYLVNALHKAGIGVIMDWVPAHFPKDAWALARFDGTPLYEDPDPSRGEHPDWGTLIFNYGRHEVRNFLVANALYWLEEFHIDGIRVDAVASLIYLDYSRKEGQWRPNIYGGRENLEAIAFLQETNATAYRNHPGIMMIAEESTSWPGVTAMTDGGGLGFGLKWNMGWMNDTLRYLAEEPINRRYHHGEITFSLVYAFSEQFLLPISHDEVVHGKGSLYSKMPGDDWQKRAGVRSLLAYQWAHPGKQLLFMGQEFAQISEWSESKGLDWWLTDNANHDQVMAMVADLNKVYVEHPALWSDDFSNHGFEWIDVSDGDHNTLTFLRKSADEQDWLVAIVNFAGTPHENYRVGLPFPGEWDEVLNTDDLKYGGSGVTNGIVNAEPIGWNGRAHSAALRVPPLGVVYLSPKDARKPQLP